ncbi:RluA family pseudouridine synthase [Lacipirellula sp.]|uniref:oxygen-dependent tRNA uridine(34) hydroxylase TrhO n=1 Tax=Lacipirellula sp. TaxID=2691419 RepID=UPI003D0981BE
MPSVTNIAGYQFVPLSDLASLRQQLLRDCKAWGLRGSILISPEGINLFVAGGEAAIESLLAAVRALPGLADFTPKVSLSDDQPFRRMLVRIKKEIIAFGVPGIEPGRRTSPKLPPHELKRWLDEGRPVTLLDTRNEYEVRLGTFTNAKTLGINHFRDFPAAVAELPVEMKQQPIVMFCTGGIRCEKAGPYMEREGFEQIFQLDGGILKYFEDCGGDHYDGECFVFDRRVGLDAGLVETANAQCYSCLAPLTPADQRDERYEPGKTCPYCYVAAGEQLERTLSERAAAIAAATTPLPGSAPYDNYRPISISAKYDGRELLAMLCEVFPHLSREYWQERFERGLLLNDKHQPVAATQPVRAGERYLNSTPAMSEPDVSDDIRVLYEDAAIVVINKPAPLPLHPSGRFNRNTLQAILNGVYQPQKLRPVHRLDANTTGVVVFARTGAWASRLQPQFAAGGVEKVYLARIQGTPPKEEFVCEAPIGTETTDLGGRAIDEQGQAARTEFRPLQTFTDGTSLVEARPITGRTNQIRVHLWHLGWPIVGEQAYLPGRQLGETQTHDVDDPPLCLHALRIAFEHPQTGERVAFEAPTPSWTY